MSAISGSALSVSGPAAGLTTVVAATIASLGSYEAFLVAVVLAGVLQLLLGMFRLGAIANYFPSSVIKGMLAAIGILLLIKQIPLALGYNKPAFWSETFYTLSDYRHFFSHLSDYNKNLGRGAILISIISLTILVIWENPRLNRFKQLPAPLLVVGSGILGHYLLQQFFSQYAFHPEQLVSIPDRIFSTLMFPDWSRITTDPLIWKSGLIIGILASLETLLCVEAIDKLDRFNRISPLNHELVAQGTGNILCGLTGAIPITAVIVRGATNAHAGGRTRMSGFIHGLLILLSVLSIPFILNRIPLAALSAILIMIGYKLAHPRLFRDMYTLGLNQFLPFIITVVVICLTNLLTGVSIGLLISVYFIIQKNFKDDYRIQKTLQHETPTYSIKLKSNVTFLNKVKIRKALDQIPEYSVVIIDGSESDFIDYDILEVISEFENKAHHKHIQIILKGIDKVKTSTIH